MKVTNKELSNVSKMSQTAANILSFVADRQRNTVYTAFSGLRADMKKKFGHAVERKEFDDAFKRLAEIGAGKLECSKRGVCLGFHWSVPIREIGTILKNQDEIGTAADAVLEAKTKVEAAMKTSEKSKASIKKAVVVIIRRGQQPETVQIPENKLRDLDL